MCSLAKCLITPVLIPLGLAKCVLGLALEEGWAKRFFNAIGITASS